MKTQKLTSIRLAVVIILGLVGSAVSGFAQSASATISGAPVTGGFFYTITLLNTGSLNLNGFWYGWTLAGNNLPSIPSSLGNSRGWNNIPFGNSIMWENASGTALAPGQSGAFTFFSSSSPTAMTTPPSGESVAYVGSIDFSQNAPGDSTGVFSPTLIVPEPGSITLLAVGLLGFPAARWCKRRAR